jgi:cyclophilin family peptidyl-prolyl cis-trans isomerase
MMKEITNNNNMQDSRFFITFSPYASWADEKYTAFGRVSSGMQFLQSLQIVPVQSPANYPLSKLIIVDSGVISK